MWAEVPGRLTGVIGRCLDANTCFLISVVGIDAITFRFPAVDQLVTMSRPPSTSASSSNFRTIFVAAMKAYEKKTKTDLLTHPLATQLQSCNSPSDILAVLQDKVNDFDKARSNNERLYTWLNPTINVLYAFSATVGQGVGLVSLDFHLVDRPPPICFHRYSRLQISSLLASAFSFW